MPAVKLSRVCVPECPPLGRPSIIKLVLVKLSGVGVPHNYVRLWVAVCVTFFTVQSLLKATIYL